MPNPFGDRELVLRSMWKKLDENTHFYSNSTCEHDQFPELPGVVRTISKRSIKLIKAHKKLTQVEMCGSVMLGGRITQRINDAVTIPFVATSLVGLHQYESESESASEAQKSCCCYWYRNSSTLGLSGRCLFICAGFARAHARIPP
jgi:hypothetical protein